MVDIRQQADFIPSDRLNGQRQMVKEELGDLVFGVAEILRYLPVEAMNLDQLEVVLGWNRLIWETGIHYGLDWVKAGVEVNMDKNQANNPTWAYQFHHPFDNQVKTRDENDWVRRGLRIIRDVDPGGKLKQSNLERVITYFGYTQEVLQDSPSLASHFLRQVAINGFSVVG
ncbi:MAG TPA: hypothetical protein VN226_06255 [Anaerolineales bacterium]|nr:hypothetical protein [Anaerolineales bacterium]